MPILGPAPQDRYVPASAADTDAAMTQAAVNNDNNRRNDAADAATYAATAISVDRAFQAVVNATNVVSPSSPPPAPVGRYAPAAFTTAVQNNERPRRPTQELARLVDVSHNRIRENIERVANQLVFDAEGFVNDRSALCDSLVHDFGLLHRASEPIPHNSRDDGWHRLFDDIAPAPQRAQDFFGAYAPTWPRDCRCGQLCITGIGDPSYGEVTLQVLTYVGWYPLAQARWRTGWGAILGRIARPFIHATPATSMQGVLNVISPRLPANILRFWQAVLAELSAEPITAAEAATAEPNIAEPPRRRQHERQTRPLTQRQRNFAGGQLNNAIARLAHQLGVDESVVRAVLAATTGNDRQIDDVQALAAAQTRSAATAPAPAEPVRRTRGVRFIDKPTTENSEP